MAGQLSRRGFLAGSLAIGAGLATRGWIDPVAARTAAAAGLGPLVTDPAGLIDLPSGFRYRILTHAGDPMVGVAGSGVVPGSPDGTASFAGPWGRTHLVMNHEQNRTVSYPVQASADLTYDPGAVGGTTTIVLRKDGSVLSQVVSLAGTVNNCAGGRMPWGTWLTCEESEQLTGGPYARDHGYVFEVDPFDLEANRHPTPLTGLGRFAHEAVVADPSRGHLYLTEDAARPNGLLYRFAPNKLPNARGSLREGGRLKAMRVPGLEDLSLVSRVGTTLPVEWVKVPDPAATANRSIRIQFDYVDRATRANPVAVAREGGAVTRAHKLEGAWWGRGRAYFTSSYATTSSTDDWSPAAHRGQIWSYDPLRQQLRLEAHFPTPAVPDVPSSKRPDGPDSIAVNPWGGWLVGEDGGGEQHILVVGADGRSTVFARNAKSLSEFTGVHFSPDRKTLFANLQGDGVALAINGPFDRFA